MIFEDFVISSNVTSSSLSSLLLSWFICFFLQRGSGLTPGGLLVKSPQKCWLFFGSAPGRLLGEVGEAETRALGTQASRAAPGEPRGPTENRKAQTSEIDVLL